MTKVLKKHCKTCKCGVKVVRHKCWDCGAVKLEKFMQVDPREGPPKGWGRGGHWYCKDKERCAPNNNYR